MDIIEKIPIIELLQKLINDELFQEDVLKYLIIYTENIKLKYNSRINNRNKPKHFKSFLIYLKRYITSKKRRLIRDHIFNMLKIDFDDDDGISFKQYRVEIRSYFVDKIRFHTDDIHKIIFDFVVNVASSDFVGESKFVALFLIYIDWNEIIKQPKSLQQITAEHYAERVNKLDFILFIQEAILWFMPAVIMFLIMLYVLRKITKRPKTLQQIIRDYYSLYVIRGLPDILVTDSHFRRKLNKNIQLYLFNEYDNERTQVLKKYNNCGIVIETTYYEIFNGKKYIHMLNNKKEKKCRTYEYNENLDLISIKEDRYRKYKRGYWLKLGLINIVSICVMAFLIFYIILWSSLKQFRDEYMLIYFNNKIYIG